MLEWLDANIIDVINNLGMFGPVLGCFLIVIESILPVLPLFVFITLNFLVFGNVIGLIISWIFTILGCLLAFYLFRFKLRNYFNEKLRVKEKVNRIMVSIDKIKFSTLVILMAIPFTPAFFVNIAGGLSKISFRKYFMALVVGKLFLVYFWGFVGTSLIESIKNPIILIRIFIILGIAYIASVIVNKKLNID